MQGPAVLNLGDSEMAPSTPHPYQMQISTIRVAPRASTILNAFKNFIPIYPELWYVRRRRASIVPYQPIISQNNAPEISPCKEEH